MSSKVKSTTLSQMKLSGEKIVALTAYDFSTALLFDELVDVILVGDSLGMVIQGSDNTLSVTVDDVIYHTKAVARALRHAHLVADMPFMSYQASARDALRNAGRMLAEGKAEAVKVEGGKEIAPIVEKMVRAGIPVMGHIGLTPQSVHAFGGYKVQGKTDPAKEAIIADALALERAGAYSIVLEAVPHDLTAKLMSTLHIPLIGIGAGNLADGQILVNQDLLGINPNFQPKFVRRYANLAEVIRGAVKQYADEVRRGDFPGPENSF